MYGSKILLAKQANPIFFNSPFNKFSNASQSSQSLASALNNKQGRRIATIILNCTRLYSI